MECLDATAHVPDYLAGSLPVEDRGASHPCGGWRRVRDTLTAAEERWAPDLPAMRRRFDAVLADYRDELGGRPQNIRRLPRCATCHFPGQSCSWICRRRFTAD